LNYEPAQIFGGLLYQLSYEPASKNLAGARFKSRQEAKLNHHAKKGPSILYKKFSGFSLILFP